MWYVYLLKCDDSKLYTGCTDNWQSRLIRHQKGHVSATKNRLPIVLVSYFAFQDKYKAFEFEKYLKQVQGGHF